MTDNENTTSVVAFTKLFNDNFQETMFHRIGTDCVMVYAIKEASENKDNLNAFYSNIVNQISPDISDWFTQENYNKIEDITSNKLQFIKITAAIQEYLRIGGKIETVLRYSEFIPDKDFGLEPFDTIGMNPDISDFEISFANAVDDLIESCRGVYESMCISLADNPKMLKAAEDIYMGCLFRNFIYNC